GFHCRPSTRDRPTRHFAHRRSVGAVTKAGAGGLATCDVTGGGGDALRWTRYRRTATRMDSARATAHGPHESPDGETAVRRGSSRQEVVCALATSSSDS